MKVYQLNLERKRKWNSSSVIANDDDKEPIDEAYKTLIGRKYQSVINIPSTLSLANIRDFAGFLS